MDLYLSSLYSLHFCAIFLFNDHQFMTDLFTLLYEYLLLFTSSLTLYPISGIDYNSNIVDNKDNLYPLIYKRF